MFYVGFGVSWALVSCRVGESEVRRCGWRADLRQSVTAVASALHADHDAPHHWSSP